MKTTTPLLLTLFTLALVILSACKTTPLTLAKDDTSTTIMAGDQALLTYVHAETPAPEGVDPLYKRSAYIHPLRSPGGEILTRIQPTDHYHHYGIWNPWTHTHFGETSVDFWNLALGQGTVRFREYLELSDEENTAEIIALQDHIYFTDDGGEAVAMEETYKITMVESHPDYYILDLSSTLVTHMETGITLEAYRYGGGLGYRATEKWGTDNSTVLTSEGKTRIDADGTMARWAIIEGESSVPAGRSGILFLSHPDNRAHPEPMRVWPVDQYEGKSNVYFEFCPIRHQEWVLEPGKAYTLKYRLVVFDGTMDVLAAENYWTEFH